MKIAFVTYEYPPDTGKGGIGTYSSQTAALLAAAGIEVHVFAGSHERTSVTETENLIVHRVHCNNPQDFQYLVVPVFAEQHHRTPFDLLESAEIHGNGLGIKNCFPTLPLLVRLHAGNYLVESLKKTYYPFSGKLRYLLGALRRGKIDLGYWRPYNCKIDPDYWFTQKADFVTAPSPQMKDWAIANWQMNPQKITVIENYFAGNEMWEKARTGNSEKVILFYGRLNVLKGMVTATKAMEKILAAHPSWRWIVIGDDGFAPDGKTSMKAWIENKLSAVSSQVQFYDSVSYSKLPTFLRQASIVIVPSLFESFSYVTLEAMYAGKAIIGSSGTGITSLVQHNTNGLLANPYKPTEWVKAIDALINDGSLRQRLGAQAQASAESKCGAGNKLVDWYKSLVVKESVSAQCV